MIQFATRRTRLPIVVVLLLAACATTSPSLSPTTSPGAGPGTPSPTVEPTASPSVATITYLVQPGDTLFGIAQRFATSIEQLQAWNANAYPSLVTDPTSLQAGWTLVLLGIGQWAWRRSQRRITIQGG